MDAELRLPLKLAHVHRLVACLMGIEVALVSLSIGGFLEWLPGPLGRLFDLDAEATIPAWFSSMQLLCVGGCLLLLSTSPGRDRRVSDVFTRVAGVMFIFMSMDEASVVHERVATVIKPLSYVPTFRDNYGAWLPLYLCIASLLAVLSHRPLRSVWGAYPAAARSLAAGAAIFMFGAAGLEMLSYQYLRAGDTPGLYRLEVTLEEFFEMVGVTLMLYGTLRALMQAGAPVGREGLTS